MFAKIRYFRILFIDFCSDFDELLSEFRRYLENVEIFRNLGIFQRKFLNIERILTVGAELVHGCRVRSWVWLLCSPSCLRLTQFNFLSHIGISPSGSLESRSVCTGICTYVSLCTLFASRPSGGHFYHILKASISFQVL